MSNALAFLSTNLIPDALVDSLDDKLDELLAYCFYCTSKPRALESCNEDEEETHHSKLRYGTWVEKTQSKDDIMRLMPGLELLIYPHENENEKIRRGDFEVLVEQHRLGISLL